MILQLIESNWAELVGTEQGVSATAAVDLETADASEEEADPMLEVESSEMDKNQNVKVKASLEIRKKDHQLSVVDDSSEVDEGYKTFQEDPECPDVDFSIPMDCTTKKRPVDPSEDDIIDRKKKGDLSIFFQTIFKICYTSGILQLIYT